MDPNITVRASKDDKSRANSRMIRLALLEYEQEIQDHEDFETIAKEYRTLHETFAAVKFEFEDLDGLSYNTPAGQQLLLEWHAQQAIKSLDAHNLHYFDANFRYIPPSTSNHSLSSLYIDPPQHASASQMSDPHAMSFLERSLEEHARLLNIDKLPDIDEGFDESRGGDGTNTPLPSYAYEIESALRSLTIEDPDDYVDYTPRPSRRPSFCRGDGKGKREGFEPATPVTMLPPVQSHSEPQAELVVPSDLTPPPTPVPSSTTGVGTGLAPGKKRAFLLRPVKKCCPKTCPSESSL